MTGDSDSIDIEDVDEDKELAVNSAIAVEKEIAADTIGTVFMYTRNHFLPYVEPCVHELVELLSHYYEGIRKSAVTSLFEIIQTFYDLSGPAEWVPGSQVVSSSCVPNEYVLTRSHCYSKFLCTRMSRTLSRTLCLRSS